MQIVSYKDFQPDVLQKYSRLKRRRGNQGTKKKPTYMDCICAFDIETSTLYRDGMDPVNFMYIWQFSINNDVIVIGRTWDEFREFAACLQWAADGCYWVCYVHNLSYEWQYLKGIFDFGEDDVFATETRRVLKCVAAGCIEFRCSYILSNMSLAAFTRQFNVQHQKLSGSDFDYDIVRYPWTELTEQELAYCWHDVAGLVEALQALMNRDGDNLYTIPMTSTGYPRREMKNAMKGWSHEAIRRMQPTYEQYELLRDCFRGGNTHANRYYAGKIIDSRQLEGNARGIRSADRSSSYPDVLMNRPYPMDAWRRGEPTAENLRNLIRNGHAVMFRAVFRDLRLKNKYWPCPYLTDDKGTALGAEIDNGRILSADSYATALSDVDFRIMLSEYEFSEIRITELWFTDYKPLPEPMRDVIRFYYEKKTALKGSTDPFQILLYNKSKNILNGLYGMCAQDPVKPELVWNGKDFEESTELTPAQILQKHTRKTFLNYAWGVWCTAWARYELEIGISIAGADWFLYTDTDSVKYIDIGQDWNGINGKKQAASMESRAYAEDSTGTRHYMGVWEDDGQYLRFATLGSKRYAYDDMDGQLHITISGVNKRKGAEEMGKLENFKEGFIFQHPGKTQSDYVDDPLPRHLDLKEGTIELTSYVIITETTYNLSLSDSYLNLLRLVSGSLANLTSDREIKQKRKRGN